MIRYLLMEAVGWVFTAVGAYFIYEDTSNIIAYSILFIGIMLIVFNFPKGLRKRDKKIEDK
ncbi:MAG: hypothetical protein ACQEWU_01420 [Bacillota bacterium]|uniref:Uncharacterized protein n=1 Tax=Virgibacillus salarius TaxID=447199 RepID=A0A941IDE3_9BACI|nr:MULTISPECIES: hypothetical protein [Bacillaceae]NAZ09749.1 hypothetical protein [Agaribacter marinus]MBR7797040.1 hypothetical protein [Virgibacillus salarius]MCC2250759.1 hypothetical protein [Virgibacillus sp. AGTR]MDY7042839.1 hypothetical protein [Virgibacillus sp. M23]QRZ18067.1 hypothetical protein JUJ52_20510 [Virgibacillus sp. AGTR]